MSDDAELYELVSSPSTQLLANCVRAVLAFGGIAPSSVRDAVLDGAALSEYIAGTRSGSGLPAFVDFAKRVEINRPLALLRYVARLGGVEGSGGADADRAALAAEAVVAYLPSGLSGDAPTATRFFGELEVLLKQFAGAQTRLTYGDALVWFAATCAERAFGPGVFDAAPGMRALTAALSRDARIVDAARAVGTAAPPPSRPIQSAAAVKGPILVSGASGFIASWVVAILLQRGYTVHATVRRLGDGARHEHLRSLPGAEGDRLRLFEADLLAPGSFAAAVAGCSGAIHCASPFFFAPKADAHEELIRPAVEGTQNVLRACIAEASVQRVVMTSSVAACYVSRAAADHWYTEAQWVRGGGRRLGWAGALARQRCSAPPPPQSDLDLIRETKQHYAESKLLAEREAWRLIEVRRGYPGGGKGRKSSCGLLSDAHLPPPRALSPMTRRRRAPRAAASRSSLSCPPRRSGRCCSLLRRPPT